MDNSLLETIEKLTGKVFRRSPTIVHANGMVDGNDLELVDPCVEIDSRDKLLKVADVVKAARQDGKTFACEKCWKRFLTKRGLQMHRVKFCR